MDKIFRKRTAKRKKDKTPAAPTPLPRVAPSLNVDIRNSLILPGLTERFSVLLPTLTAAPETSVRTLLAQQRTRTGGPSLTLEEEEMLLQEIRDGRAPRPGPQYQQQKQQQHLYAPSPNPSSQLSPQSRVTNISEWDGNPPHLESDWGPASFRSGSAMSYATATTPIIPGPGSDGASSPHSPGMSPSNSANSLNPSQFNTFGREKVKMRSYGFSSAQSGRDHNYLNKITKSPSKNSFTSSPDSPTRRMNAGERSQSSQGRSASPTSDGTVTPTGSINASVQPSFNTLPRSNRQPPPPASEAFQYHNEPLKDEPLPVRRTPLDAPGPTPRIPSGNAPQPQKRQSLMVGISQAQAKRISLALLEIETHLGQDKSMRHTEDDDDQDHEEMLDANGEGEYDPQGQYQGHALDRQHSGNSSTQSSVFPYAASPASGGAPSSAFPYASPASQGGASYRYPEDTHLPTIPSSPRNDDASSAGTRSPELAMRSPDATMWSPESAMRSLEASARSPVSVGSPMAQLAYPQLSPGAQGKSRHQSQYSASSTRSGESDTDYNGPQRPALTPYRPQPVRYTPSPSFGMAANAAVPGYVPGQPRPVRGSISSKGSTPIGSPQSPYTPPQVNEQMLIGKRSYPAPARAGQQLARSLSAQQERPDQNSRSLTPTQRIEHVPTPGVLSLRHQASHSIDESYGAWRSGSAMAVHSPPGRGVVNIDETDEVMSESYENDDHEAALPESPEPTNNLGLATEEQSTLPAADNESTRFSMRSVQSTFDGPPAHEGNSPWDALFGDPKTEHVPPSGDEQDRVDLELLKNASGMGKEELSLIQRRLVEKAQAERDRLRQEQMGTPPLAEHAILPSLAQMEAREREEQDRLRAEDRQRSEVTPVASPTLTSAVSSPGAVVPLPYTVDNWAPSIPATTTRGKSPSDTSKTPPLVKAPASYSSPAGTPPVKPASNASSSSAQLSTVAQFSSPQSQSFTPQSTQQAQQPLMSPSSGAFPLSPTAGQYPSQEFAEAAARAELPKGPPPPRPQPPGSQPASNGQTPVNDHTPASEVPNSAEGDESGHGRNNSGGRKWLDDTPEERKGIEERIANATTELFRAPSRGAHKRTLSKKNISTPKLVSSSNTVPTTPITSMERSKSQKGSKWKKLGLGRKSSMSGLDKPAVPSTPASPNGPPPSAFSRPKTPTTTDRTQMPRTASDSAAAALAAAHRAKTPDHRARTPSGTQRPKTPIDVQRPRGNEEQRKLPHPPQQQHQPPQPQQGRVNLTGFKFPLSGSTEGLANGNANGNGVSKKAPSVEGTAVTAATAALQQAVNGPQPQAHNVSHDGSHTPSTSESSSKYTGPNQNGSLVDRPPTNASYTSTARTTTQYSHTSLSPTNAKASLDTPRINAPGWERRISPVAEDVADRPGSLAGPNVVRRTIVMSTHGSVDLTVPPNNYGPAPSTPPRPGSGLPPSPLRGSFGSGASERANRSPKRGNSIRRKPIPMTSEDHELMESSPIALHARNFSQTSGASEVSQISSHFSPELPQPGFAYTPGKPKSINSVHSANLSVADSADMVNSSSHASFYDYYQNEAAPDRGSQAVEITEYADGRVVWNIVNALRGEERDSLVAPDYARGSLDYSRASLDVRDSMAQSENSGQDDLDRGSTEDLAPWRVGPTQGLSFMRRPETRVYYTSATDVADLIDHLSADVAGAGHGRIDIWPSDLTAVAAQDDGHSPGQFADAPSPGGPGSYGSAQQTPVALQQAGSPPRSGGTLQPGPARKPLFLGNAHQRYAAGITSPRAGVFDHAESPSAASFGSMSDGSAPEKSVEDRLQALMDRLKAAPGGIRGA